MGDDGRVYTKKEYARCWEKLIKDGLRGWKKFNYKKIGVIKDGWLNRGKGSRKWKSLICMDKFIREGRWHYGSQ